MSSTPSPFVATPAAAAPSTVRPASPGATRTTVGTDDRQTRGTSVAPTTAPDSALPRLDRPTDPAEPARTIDRLLDVVGANLSVPLIDGRRVRYANLDYAATAPALRAVAERVAKVLPFSGSVHRGAGLPSQASSRLYEAARARVATALGARADDHVVFVRNTTDATNLLAGSIPADAGDVLTLDIEHHANLLPWKRLAGRTPDKTSGADPATSGSGHAGPGDTPTSRTGDSASRHRTVVHADTIGETLRQVEVALCDRPTALLAVTGASNVTGEVLPIDRLAALAHAYGARIFVDAAQLAPHRRIHLTLSDVDYVAFSGHKLYAPYGSGVLVGRRDWLDAAEPYLAGGGAVRNVTVDHTDWATGPQRHEGGTPNLTGAVAIVAALDELDTLVDRDGFDAREAHEAALTARLRDGIATIDGVTTHRIWDDDGDTIGVVTFSVEGYAPGLVGAYLSAEYGIGVRDGRFCAHPLLERFGLPGGALRASFGVGSRSDDVDRLLAALHRLVSVGPGFAYCEGPTGWVPQNDTRDIGDWIGADLGRSPAAAGVSPCRQAA
jgi:selenocysteine lyase/cysteine desulfurase